MARDDIAQAVLAALGGRDNVLTNTVCMTRLRVTLADPQAVDYDAINEVPSVLGTAARGNNGLEVVFGPRVIDEVYHSFILLTGKEAGSDALFPMARPSSNFSVRVSGARQTPEPQTSVRNTTSDLDDDDIDVLQSLFSPTSEAKGSVSVRESQPVEKKLLILNGPNINLLGLADNPDEVSFASLLETCKDEALEAGFDSCICFQSNHEGDLIDKVQDAYGVFDAIVINPGSYARTSIGLRDSLMAVGIPALEVRFSSEAEDSESPTDSCVSAACIASITDEGTRGYQTAIRQLASHLEL